MDKKQESQVPILTPKKVRGTATIYGSGDIDFRAYGEGGPAKEVIKSIGSSQLYKTTGAKSPKLCAHLMCPDDDPDPQSTFDDLLGKILLLGIIHQFPHFLITLSEKHHRCCH